MINPAVTSQAQPNTRNGFPSAMEEEIPKACEPNRRAQWEHGQNFLPQERHDLQIYVPSSTPDICL